MASEPLIDVEALLAEIPGDSPAGVDIREEAPADGDKLNAFDRLRQLRNPEREHGPDWNGVIEDARTILQTRSKDVEVAGWLTEALAKKSGEVRGMRDGLQLVAGLLERYADQLHPTDPDVRNGRIGWLDSLDPLMRQLGLTPAIDGRRFSLFTAMRDPNTPSSEPNLEGSRADFEAAIRPAVASECHAVYEDLLGCAAALDRIEAEMERQFGDDAMPPLQLSRAVADCTELLTATMRARGVEVPSATPRGDDFNDGNPPGADRSDFGGGTPTATISGSPTSRREAVQCLIRVAEYFRRNEPSSPVPFAIERAIRWADMPLDKWLRSVVREEGVLEVVLRDILDSEKRDAEKTGS